MPEYLVKFVARSGAASRRGAADLIKTGHVDVNGKTVRQPAFPVDAAKDAVTLDGRRLQMPDELVYLMLNKPRGYTTTLRDAHAARLAVELIDLPVGGKLVSAGRLDRESEGLLIFSNDGDFIHRLTHPRYGLSKRYRVTADRALTEAQCRNIREGILDAGESLKADHIEPAGPPHCYFVVLHEGRKREIRRLLKACGAQTLRLERLALGGVELGDLPPGQWRRLTARELALLAPPPAFP